HVASLRLASPGETKSESLRVPGEGWRGETTISPGEVLSRLANSHYPRPLSSTLARRASPEIGAQPRTWP
ncbi:hypothetical protein A2U01_0066520, partial [Trifolium medium]|nr:hypothetical protein [Trifolium medium]